MPWLWIFDGYTEWVVSMASRKDGGGKLMSLGWSTGLAGGKGVRGAHCSTAMSTRPVRYSGFFAWFILLWPRHDHFSSQINFIRGVFWKIDPFVVTQLNWWKFFDGPLFTCFAFINDFICKIVTKIEILTLVLLQSSTNFKRYRPILGDMPNWRII